MGKTRLALEAAQRQLNHFGQGIFWVDLAPLSSPSGIVPAIAAAIGIQFIQSMEISVSQPFDSLPDLDVETQLHGYLRGKQMLLVLDNFEHLLAGVDRVDAILSAAPQVKMLVTSREALHLDWEYLYDVFGMQVPAEDETPNPDEHSAVQLFVERAQQAQRLFSLRENANYVGRICRLLDGMPLGLELAASWLRVLPCGELVTELERNLVALTSRQHAGEERHRSLRTVFEQSWRLLIAGNRTY